MSVSVQSKHQEKMSPDMSLRTSSVDSGVWMNENPKEECENCNYCSKAPA